jgi:ABC-2 type transport system permease protein
VGEVATYRRLVGARVRSQLRYRTSFITSVLAQALVTFADCIVILALFGRVPALGGWDRGQVLVLYAISVLAFGFADAVASPVEQTAIYVRDGTFDQLLVRPASVLGQLLGDEFSLRDTGRTVQASMVLAVTLATGEAVLPSVPRALFLVPTVLCGAITFGALFVMVNTLSFWFPGSREVGNAFTYGGETVAHYPTHMFQPWFRRFVFFVVPVGVVCYVPGIFILDAPNPLGIPEWLQLLSPLVFVPVCAAAALVWRLGLHRYESTGS